MSFRIHAVGSTAFRYSSDNCADQEIFQAAAIISALRASDPTSTGAASGIADYVVPSETGLARDTLMQLARLSFLQTLRLAVDMLATCSGARQGWISVYATRAHAAWPDTSRTVRYSFVPGNHPASEFLARVLPQLEVVGLNNFGALRQLSIALSRYNEHLGSSGRPMIQISLFA